jgi:hypothetical protein
MLAGALLLCAPLSLSAQAVAVSGRIHHGGPDDRPLDGQWAVLLEIRADSSGPADSARTDARGRYRLALSRVDTAALYVVITRYQDVEYFARLEPAVAGRARAEPIVVYDTTTAGPPIRLEGRFFNLFQSGDGGGRRMLEIVQVSNPGDRTRVAPDTANPVWKIVLPRGATGWGAGEGNLDPEGIRLAGDTVKVFAPIWPGTTRYASYQYALTGRAVRIPLDQWTGQLGLLLEDTTAVVSGALLTSLGVNEVEGRRFASYRGGPFEAGSELLVTFSRGPLKAEQLVPYVAGAAALVLAWGLWVALRKRPL